MPSIDGQAERACPTEVLIVFSLTKSDEFSLYDRPGLQVFLVMVMDLYTVFLAKFWPNRC